MKNRTREICTSGTVRDEGGNILIYSANDRGDRGNVGIIRSPIRASILPDHNLFDQLVSSDRIRRCDIAPPDVNAASSQMLSSGHNHRHIADTTGWRGVTPRRWYQVRAPAPAPQLKA